MGKSNKVSKSTNLPFPSACRSRSTSVGSSRVENSTNDLTPEKTVVYPSLLDVSRNMDLPQPGTVAKLPGVPGLPDIEYPSVLQLDFGEPAFIPTPSTQAGTASSSSCPVSSIGAPPGLELMSDERLTSSCPASMMEMPPGFEDEALPIVIPKMQAVVPPPPVEPPVLPGTLPLEPTEPPAAPTDPAECAEILGLPAYVDFTGLCVSLGSAGHGTGTCKPCAFFHTKGCSSGKNCTFCHMCPPGEKKRRAKLIKMAAKLSNLQAEQGLAESPLSAHAEKLLPAELFEEALRA
ncbi:unnamed protein product [Symbiodinium natans]|uniref:C3H1-type domain-containing protein n=1 Tax=Symbiodinium natans TaxID=878477 RepID=A0A812LLQ3_9DINO|nr:unnamed protein product [Symbiodinium natans]